MALLFMDSFDHYATADITEKWSTSGTGAGGSISIGSGNGRRGTNGFRFLTGFSGGGVGFLQKALVPTDATTCIMGFAVVIPAGAIGTVGGVIAVIKDSTTPQVTLKVNSDFTLTVLRGNQIGTWLGQSSGSPMSAGVMAYVEWKVVIHPSAGTVEVRVNGNVVPGLNLTGQNTRASGFSTWTSVVLGTNDNVGSSWSGGNLNVDFDDVYVCDGSGSAPWNTFLGDCRVDALRPTAEGTSSQWTPLSGTDNAAMVNQTAPDDDTTYVSTVTSGHTDTYVTPDAPVAGAAIMGVQLNVSIKKEDAGSCAVSGVVRHSGTNYPVVLPNPGTTYAYQTVMMPTNPGTGVAWTEAGFNAAEFGFTRL